jgi:hypothetical protein
MKNCSTACQAVNFAMDERLCTNIWEENAAIQIPVLPNYADIASIAKLVPDVLNDQNQVVKYGMHMKNCSTACQAVNFAMDERLCTWLEDGEQGFVPVQGIELIKAFNIWEENAAIQIPVLPN